MQPVVLDTDIIIDFLRTGGGLFPYLLDRQANGDIELYLSAVTVFELLAGSMPAKQKELVEKLLSYFHIIPFDHELASFAGIQKRGKKLTINLADYIIGISAVHNNAKLATRNKKHFTGIPKLSFYE